VFAKFSISLRTECVFEAPGKP